ncbi:MAG: hypothetical protein ACRDZ2_09735, partial [Ilumatobacteraceae bacterium]
MNQARMHNTVAAVLALAVASAGFSVGDLATKVHTMTGQSDPRRLLTTSSGLRPAQAARQRSRPPTRP